MKENTGKEKKGGRIGERKEREEGKKKEEGSGGRRD